MADDSSNIEITEDPTERSSGMALVDLVVAKHSEFVCIKSEAFDFSLIFSSESTSETFEEIVKKKSKKICSMLQKS